MIDHAPFVLAPREAGLPRSRARSYATMLATLAVLSVVVLVAADSYWLQVFTSCFCLAIAVAGVGLLYGRLGLISLCQYALVGIGGWTALRVDQATHVPFEVSVVLGGVAAGLVGILWGLPALRLKGLHLALVTLMLAGAFQVAIIACGFPDGGPGFLGRVVNGDARVMMSRPIMAASDRTYFVYVGIVLLVGLVLVEWHRQARPGRAWALISKDERMAVATGVNLVFYKAWAFALAGFLAGIAGGLLAGVVGQLDGTSFTAASSILLFALSVVAGVDNWGGALLGGILLRAPAALLNIVGVNGYVAQVLFGALLVQSLIAGPQGIAGDLRKLFQRLIRGRKETAE